MSVTGRFRNWCFTFNNPPHALTPEVDLVGSHCTFLAWQLELGEEGTEHYQGYLELDAPCSLLQVLQMGDHMFLGAHFEVIYFAPFLCILSTLLCISRATFAYSPVVVWITTRSMLTCALVRFLSWWTRQSWAANAAPPSSSCIVPVFLSSLFVPSTKYISIAS